MICFIFFVIFMYELNKSLMKLYDLMLCVREILFAYGVAWLSLGYQPYS